MEGDLEDTICGIATPAGEGGIGIVRISGERALRLASRIVRVRSGRSLQDIRTHTLYLSDVLAPPLPDGRENSNTNGRTTLDEAMVVAMRAPRSYTGEDVLEIHCHGGPLILHTLCDALIREGARLAEPGEFTKRAFLNGRLDLTQAEAVLDTIRATTSMSLRVAQGQLRGQLYKTVEGLRSELIRLLAHVEAGIDFVEEDITFIERNVLKDRLGNLIERISKLVATSNEGRVLREGIRTAIVGRPNVGKSSLLNGLLQTDRAIVSSIPGTTRDVIEEILNIEGVPVRLVDTAGLREAKDPLEGEGIRRTKHALIQAELLMIVIDGSKELTQKDVEIFKHNHDKKRLIVVNKSDLPSKVSELKIQSLLCSNSSNDHEQPAPAGFVRISAKTGEGMDQLRQEVKVMALGSHFETGDSVLLTKLRHKTSVLRAKEALVRLFAAIDGELAGECIALDLRVAAEALGEITGQSCTEDVLDKIFQEFCIGK